MLLTYIYLDIVPDVPDTSGESKNNIGPPSGGPKSITEDLAVVLQNQKKVSFEMEGVGLM